jgi:SSS family solute:Na+ symporter
MLVTIVISLFTKAPEESALEGLVYGMTKLPKDEVTVWYQRPTSLAVVVLVLLVGFNLIFW